jgi:CRP-like cAMP-binding protein
MEVFKSEAREVIRRFVDRRLTFPQCVVALEDALADVTPRLSGPQIPLLHALILQNNSIVMKEMEKRGQPPSDPKILAALRDGITISAYRPGELIYSQGDPGQAVFYIQEGRVKLTAVSKLGKQAVVGILGPASFVGEGCLKQQPHPATARAIGKCWIERLNKATMNRLLGDNLAFSGLFLAHLLSRNVRMRRK